MVRGRVRTQQQSQESRRSDEVASQLAYECGWRACEDNLRTLEGQRTRSLALFSVAILAVGIAVSAFLGKNLLETLGCVGVIGGIVFVLGVLGVSVCSAWMAWPLRTMTVLRPTNIISGYVNPQHPQRTPAWVYKNLAKNLDKALGLLQSQIETRSRVYVGAIIFTMVMLAGVVILVFDVAV